MPNYDKQHPLMFLQLPDSSAASRVQKQKLPEHDWLD
jgi:hypothetical protein